MNRQIIAKKLSRLAAISLNWKLAVPFLFLSFIGTVLLVYVGLESQRNLIQTLEKRQLLVFYKNFLDEIKQKEGSALSLAGSVAQITAVQEAFAARDRWKLIELLYPVYLTLKDHSGVSYFHFHTPPANSFLRLHRLYQFGDQMASYRKTILQVVKTREPIAGLELGVTGYGVRGVYPIFYHNQFIGTVEVGYAFGEAFFENFKARLGIELSLYMKEWSGKISLLHTTEKGRQTLPMHLIQKAFQADHPEILISPPEFADRSEVLGRVFDFSGKVVGVVEIRVNRTNIIERLNYTRNMMVGVGIAGIIFSFVCVLLISARFLKPIRRIIFQAREIADGKRKEFLEPGPMDEVGVLIDAVNTLLGALTRSREQIEGYAAMLEVRVSERTMELIASEEKYRTLVENVPLVVYRLQTDGQIVFINQFVEEIFGYSVMEMFKNSHLWLDSILQGDRSRVEELRKQCLEQGKELVAEYRVRNKDGHIVYLMDHAIPFRGPNGEVTGVDGIIMDVTGRVKLQEKILRTEELKTLSEISSRLAHEIRNPLVSAGGFARRLMESLNPDDPNRYKVEIIVKEMSRLELILTMVLTYIQPLELRVVPTDINRVIGVVLDGLKETIAAQKVKVHLELEPGLPLVSADPLYLERVLDTLLKNALFQMPEAGILHLITSGMDDTIQVTIRYPDEHMSQDDVDQFFFPFTTPKLQSIAADLPLSRIILHKLGGDINVRLEKPGMLLIQIVLPATESSAPMVSDSQIEET
jgi:PAS domain S-box-containing protein